MLQQFLSLYNERKGDQRKRAALDITIAIFVKLVVILIEAALVMLLWNAIVPRMFARNSKLHLNYGMALGLKLMLAFLF